MRSLLRSSDMQVGPGLPPLRRRSQGRLQ